MAGKDSYGKEDLYISLRDSLNNWSRPVNLGPSINTEGYEIGPFLSSDMKRLYFSSEGHGGYGSADIFVSERPYDNWTIWTQPKNLGKVINSEKFDSYFSIYGDTISFFSSNRDSDQADVYSSLVTKKVDTIQYLKDDLTYLSESEVAKLAGTGFRNTLSFTEGQLELTQIHKNQLTAAGKVMAKRHDLFIRLEVRNKPGSKRLEENQRRLLNALGFLKTVGVEGSRVTFGSENDSGLSDDVSTWVVVRFYH
jgi:hypothetical protein